MADFLRRDGDIWKGAVAGIAGGLVESWVMNQFQDVVLEIREPAETKAPEGSSPEDGEDATVKTAERISRGVFDHELEEDEKDIAGPAVHYAMGAVSGGIYGVAAELIPLVTRGAGLPFGTAVWLAADEAAVPALGLAPSPRKVPKSTHAREFGAHLVYGLTTELFRWALRRTVLRG